MSSPIVCTGLTKRFRKVLAVNDSNLEVPEGSIYGLIGANGAGKTSLIKMLVNILRPTSGSCQVLDKDSRALSAKDFTQIGYVSENHELPEWMTVNYFLAYLKPFYPNWDESLAKELVDEFELPVDRPLRQLSRGIKMKAALASSLAYRPRLILLDEPFSGLDALVREEFAQGLLERAGETTILISSHDLAEIESFASHIGFLESGRMQFSEETTTLMSRFRRVEVRLDGPADASNWPEHWLKPESLPTTVRFVESKFDDQETKSAIAQCFPGALDVSMAPMSLREIFVTLAQIQRKHAA